MCSRIFSVSKQEAGLLDSLRVCLIRKTTLICVVQLKCRLSLVDELIILLNELWHYFCHFLRILIVQIIFIFQQLSIHSVCFNCISVICSISTLGFLVLGIIWRLIFLSRCFCSCFLVCVLTKTSSCQIHTSSVWLAVAMYYLTSS